MGDEIVLPYRSYSKSLVDIGPVKNLNIINYIPKEKNMRRLTTSERNKFLHVIASFRQKYTDSK